MSRLIDLTGQRFQMLLVLKKVPGSCRWLCRCDCGVERALWGHGLRNGRSRSCGCARFRPDGWENSRIERTATCWNWTGHVGVDGYGKVRVGGRRGDMRLAHRYFYERAMGPVPAGLHLDHLCRNRRCVRPDHLEPVTQAENNRRGVRAKLTHGQVRDIVMRRAAGAKVKDLAAELGVGRNAIGEICSGKRWGDLTADLRAALFGDAPAPQEPVLDPNTRGDL